eukprot:SAG31_NODE_31586_length_366_cov_0.955056_1_plen_54_part_10
MRACPVPGLRAPGAPAAALRARWHALAGCQDGARECKTHELVSKVYIVVYTGFV